MIRFTVGAFLLLCVFYGCGNDNPVGVETSNPMKGKIDLSDAYEVQRITSTGGVKEKPFFVSWDEFEICFAQGKLDDGGISWDYKLLDLDSKSKNGSVFSNLILGEYDRWRPNCSSSGNLQVYIRGYYSGQLVFTNGLNQDLYSIDTYEGFFQSVALSRDGKKFVYIKITQPLVREPGSRDLIDKSNGLSREMVVGSMEGNGGDNIGRIHFDDIHFDDSGMSYIDNACFSPDATEIVFEAIKDGNKDLYLTSLSGAITHLTYNKADDSFPCFSPNGGKIVFISKRHGGDDIYIMDLSKPTGK